MSLCHSDTTAGSFFAILAAAAGELVTLRATLALSLLTPWTAATRPGLACLALAAGELLATLAAPAVKFQLLTNRTLALAVTRGFLTLCAALAGLLFANLANTLAVLQDCLAGLAAVALQDNSVAEITAGAGVLLQVALLAARAGILELQSTELTEALTVWLTAGRAALTVQFRLVTLLAAHTGVSWSQYP